jgi:hypothetical protein
LRRSNVARDRKIKCMRHAFSQQFEIRPLDKSASDPLLKRYRRHR